MPLKAIHTDQEKIQLFKLKAGEEAAFEYFYKNYSLIIYRRLLRLVKVDIIADDLLQNIFIKLWDKRHLIDPERPLKAYLLQITQNMVMDFYRGLAREQRLQSDLKHYLTEISGETEESLIFKETSQLLQQAIDLLPAQQRIVFKLCKIEGKSYDEVSELLGISTSTVNGHIVKGSRKVRSFLFNTHTVFLVGTITAALNDVIKII